MVVKTKPQVKKPVIKKAVAKKATVVNKVPRFDFPVSLVDLKTVNGIRVPNRGVYRSDTKKVIAVVGSDYKIIKHKEVLDQIESKLPIIVSTRKIQLCKGGNYLFANYESNKIAPVEPRKGDIVKFGVQVFNSYNGRLPVGLRLYAVRLKCTNGMTVPQSISSLHVRHLPGANIIEAKDAFLKKLEQFAKQAPVWTKWAHTKAPKGRVDSFLKQYVSSKGAREIIKHKFDTDNDDTLWGLFNAITWFGTHIVTVRGIDKNTKERDLTKVPDLARKQFSFDRRVVEKFYKYSWN